MDDRDTSVLDSWCAPQLKIILLGGRNSGKSSLGNLILGKEEFATKERTSCSRRLGVVTRQWLTVVDTPGWWCDFSSRDTSALVKREIISSVSLCAPGPHVFLITVKASSGFSERRRRAVEEHVALLGEKVWSHCLVVFTSAQRTKQREFPVEEKALRWLREKCSQRCHSITLSDEDEDEVAELLVKIHRLVTENGNKVFEMEDSMSQAIAEDNRRAEERAQHRLKTTKKHRSAMREKLRPLTNIRIVLLGAKGSGKTSALNTILGRGSSQRLQRTAQCGVGEGVVFGRQLTVVDTPGWWMNYFLDESPIFDQRELLLSLSQCPPGPHVFLLVIRVDRAFTETYRRAAQEHVELISEHIWSRVIVLFSFGDWLGGTTAELYIESEGEPLQWLVGRCGNRYHVVNNKVKGDGFQVRELIGKVEEMVSGCDSSWYYEMDKKVSDQLKGMLGKEKERAEERLRKKEKRREMTRSQTEKLISLPELRVVLIGGRKTGKSSCGNTILSRDCFNADNQTSCTEQQGRIGRQTVTVVDTPGGFPVTSDLLTPPRSCCILLVVNVSSSFTYANGDALEKQLEGAGPQAWSRAAVLFSFGDWLGDTSIEQRIESEGKALQTLVERCGNRYHVLDNKHWGDGSQVHELLQQLEDLLLVEERLPVLHRDDHLGRSLPSHAGSQREKGRMSCRRQRSHDSLESAASTSFPSLHCSAVTEEGGRLVALPGGGGAGRTGLTVMDRDGFMSCLSSALFGRNVERCTTTGQQRLMINLPVWLPTDDPSSRLNGEVGLLSPRHPTVVLVLPQKQRRTLPDQSAHPLCRHTQTEHTLTESGELQASIDQWGDRSLEELEAFIDLYFETVWEQAVSSAEPPRPATAQDAEVREAGEHLLVSIDRKLSKLNLLEGIRNDLTELRKSLELSWRMVLELTDKSRQDDNDTC